jgi:diadenosine tetraphosphatase ApaH/serine/threonine PP2A family protein phosphatase
MKTLIVGDIHGCFGEFRALLKEASIVPGRDRIVSVGDIINRGPDSLSVVRFFRDTPNAFAVMGNHERMFRLKQYDDLTDPSFAITLNTVKEREAKEIEEFVHSLPLFLRFEEVVVLHAGLDPSKALENQDPDVLVGNGPEDKKLVSKTSWYDEIHYPVPVAFGHTISEEVIRGKRNNVWGLDGGCYKGGKLTGLLIPEWKTVSVPSQNNYFEELKHQYLSRIWRKNIEDMEWLKIAELDESYIDESLRKKIDSLMRQKSEVKRYADQRCEELKDEINYPYFKTSEQKELLNYLQKAEFPLRDIFLRAFEGGLAEKDIEHQFPVPRELCKKQKALSDAADAMSVLVRDYFKQG